MKRRNGKKERLLLEARVQVCGRTAIVSGPQQVQFSIKFVPTPGMVLLRQGAGILLCVAGTGLAGTGVYVVGRGLFANPYGTIMSLVFAGVFLGIGAAVLHTGKQFLDAPQIMYETANRLAWNDAEDSP